LGDKSGEEEEQGRSGSSSPVGTLGTSAPSTASVKTSFTSEVNFKPLYMRSFSSKTLGVLGGGASADWVDGLYSIATSAFIEKFSLGIPANLEHSTAVVADSFFFIR